MKVKVIPLVIGTLGTTPIKLRYWLKEIGIETQITELQKTVLLHTAPTHCLFDETCYCISRTYIHKTVCYIIIIMFTTS